MESDVRNDTTMCGVPKLGDRGGHGKLSIKRRRKKVKFSVEKPTALARKVPTSSPKMESAASSSRNLLNMFAEEERMESGYGMLEATSEQARMKNGNGNMEPVFIEEVHVSGSINEDENEGSNYPARKKARLDSSPAKIDTVSSQEVPCSSQQLGHDVSRILETPAPQMGRSNFTISINRVILSNRFTIRSKFDSNKPNEREEKNRKNALDQIGLSQSVSTKVCAHQDVLSIGNNQRSEGRPQPIAVAMTETPFVQASGLSGSSGVTKVMETPFISNVHVPSDDEEIITNPRISSDGDVEQCESILANETEIDMDNNNHTPTSDKIQSQTGIAENLFSNSILVKETQDTDHSSSDHDDSLATDGSCTVLGPTQVTSVSESQFSQSVTAPASKPRAVLRQSPQIIDGSSLNLQKVGGEHKLQTQHDRRSSNGSESSSTCSPVQSSGTVCIGETQFTKSESKLSPEERQTVSVPPTGICAMPLPPASPSEIQSPVIPLQNSAHLPHSGSAMQVSQQQPSGSVSKIAETQLSTSSDHDIVPSSQPSPTASKRQSAATLPKLPGLTTVQYRKPQPQATITDDRISLEQKEKEDTKQNCDSQTLAVQQSEVNGHSTKSPLKFFAVEQNWNEHTAESTTAVVPIQSIGSGACVNVPLSSMSLAYSSLQSQRASLQSQISSCMDLSSQQLEILRLEMEAKQREIDELEAALRQVEEEEREIQPETPAASTQSSVRSITAIAETMPSNAGQMVSPDHASSPEHCAPGSVENPLSGQAKSNTAIADSLESTPSSDIDRKRATSPECMDIYVPESIENPLSGHTKSLEHSQVAVRPDHVSTIPALLVTNSQVSREQRSMEHSQMRAPSSTISSQILSDGRTTMKIQAVKRIAPNSHQSEALEKVKSAQHQSQIEANPTVTSEDLHAHVSKVATNYSFVGARSSHVSKTTSSLHSETETDTESDIGSEAPCTSQSVLATLQAADDVLRKLRSPPLAVLEERSSMEIDMDLYSSGTPAPHKQSLKAKKLRISTDSAKPTCVSDKVQTALVQKDSTLEVDAQLCTNSTKEEISAKSGKGSASTSRGKRAHSTSTKLKSKKTKKAPLVVYESEDTAVTRLPEFRNQNQVTTTKSSSNTFTDAKPSGLHPSSPCLPSITQSPDQGHCNREGGRGSTTPTYRAVVLRTPKAQCSSDSGTTSSSGKEVPAVSPCRLLSRVGKDHPPSYIGSGLSKTQLVSYDKINTCYCI